MRRVVLVLVVMGLMVGLGWYAATQAQRATSDTATLDEPGRYPSEFGWIQRTFPHFKADPDVYRRAFVEVQHLRAAAKSATFGSWQLVGPTNIGGRISDVEFDPISPNVAYASASTGGVFKSTDTGETWHPIFDDQPVMSIGDIAVDPINSQVLYVGTGEANGGHNNFAGAGVYKSTDGGATWSFAGLEKTTSIGRILVDPANPNRVFLAAIGSYFAPTPDRGVYRSLDAGATWSQVLGPVEGTLNDSTGVIDLVMRPDSTNVLFAATWQRVRRVTGAQLNGEGSGIYKSTDGGETWARADSANGLPSRPAGRIGLSISLTNPDVIYALYTNGTTYLGLYRTNDGGETWFDADPDQDLDGGFGNFSWFFGQVRVAPDDPDLVYVMDVRFMRSVNGGRTWTRQTGTHVDHHALAFHPIDPSIVINGNDGGLALSQNGGVTWEKVFDLPITQFYEIGLDPTNPTQFYGGTQDNGTLKSNGPDNWERILGGDGFYVIVDPDNPSTVYAERQFGGLVKITGAQTNSATRGIPSNASRNWSTPIAIDPNDSQVLYYGTDRIYRTEDGAENWEAISDDLTRDLDEFPLIGTLSTIAVAPTNSNVIYAGTDDGKVWVSSNYGATWNDITGDELPFRWVTRVVVDPTDEQTAYVTYSGLRWNEAQPHVFRTRDRGQTWENITNNLPDAPVNAFAVDPRNPNYLYLGNDIGAFVSEDGGASWALLGEGLPAVSVYDMKIFESIDLRTGETTRFLAAGTHGRSMYTIDLSDVPGVPTAVEDDASIPQAIALEAGYPNPFTTSTTLAYRLSERADVRLEIYDVLGRRVTTLYEGSAAPGAHTSVWNASGVAPGSYVARLTVTSGTGPSVYTTTLTRVR